MWCGVVSLALPRLVLPVHKAKVVVAFRPVRNGQQLLRMCLLPCRLFFSPPVTSCSTYPSPPPHTHTRPPSPPCWKPRRVNNYIPGMLDWCPPPTYIPPPRPTGNPGEWSICATYAPPRPCPTESPGRCSICSADAPSPPPPPLRPTCGNPGGRIVLYLTYASPYTYFPSPLYWKPRWKNSFLCFG